MSTTTTLGDICSSIVDCEHKTAPIDPNGKHFAVGTPAMKDGVIKYEEARRISKATFDQWSRRLRPEVGDLLLAREAPVGPIVEIPDTVNVAPGQRTVLLRPNPDLVSSKFLFYLLQSPEQQSKFRQKSAGSTVAHLNVADVRRFELPKLPHMKAQHAVGEILGALDQKIQLSDTIAFDAASLSDAIFSEMYARITPLEVNLSDLVSTQYGLTTSPVDSAEGHFLIRVTDINKKPWIQWWSAPLCLPSSTEIERYVLRPGDIVVARMADPGKVGFIDEGFPSSVFASYLVRLSALDPTHSLFIYHYLRSSHYRTYSEGAISGSVQKNMNARVIVDTTVKVPSQGQLNEFNHKSRALRSLISTALGEIRALTMLRDTLLPPLVSGRLSVRDAYRQVTDAL